MYLRRFYISREWKSKRRKYRRGRTRLPDLLFSEIYRVPKMDENNSSKNRRIYLLTGIVKVVVSDDSRLKRTLVVALTF